MSHTEVDGRPAWEVVREEEKLKKAAEAEAEAELEVKEVEADVEEEEEEAEEAASLTTEAEHSEITNRCVVGPAISFSIFWNLQGCVRSHYHLSAPPPQRSSAGTAAVFPRSCFFCIFPWYA